MIANKIILLEIIKPWLHTGNWFGKVRSVLCRFLSSDPLRSYFCL